MDFFSWQSRKQDRRQEHERHVREHDETAQLRLQPEEPMKVEEHDPNSTTIIRRFMRMWTDKR